MVEEIITWIKERLEADSLFIHTDNKTVKITNMVQTFSKVWLTGKDGETFVLDKDWVTLTGLYINDWFVNTDRDEILELDDVAF